jgi:hypothetical protein
MLATVLQYFCGQLGLLSGLLSGLLHLADICRAYGRMDLLTSLIVSLFGYFIWANFGSDSSFHRVWSTAIFILPILSLGIYHSLFSSYTPYLLGLAVLDALICVGLSPLQLLFRHSEPPNSEFMSLEVHFPKSSSPDQRGDGEHELLAEFVAPWY